MKKEHISQEIQTLVETITDQWMQMMTHRDKIPLIELDITLSNIAKLYENLSWLKKVNEKEEALPAIEAVIIAAENQPLNVIPEKEIPVQPLPVEKPSIVSFVVNPAVTEVKQLPEPIEEVSAAVSLKLDDSPLEVTIKTESDEEKKWKEEIAGRTNEIFREEIKRDTTAKKTPVQSMGLFDTVTTVAGQYEEQPTLHDKISKTQTDSSLGKKYQKKAVEDLKKSIGINEKFSFINELFEGDLGNYNKAIDTLNQSGNLEEASNYISSQLIPKYSWSDNNKSFLSLKELVERRFTR
jgi:hypothetical protein